LRWTTVGVSAAVLLLLAWTLLPLPGWFGRVTLLDRVPGARTSLAVGLGVTILLAIGATVLARRRWPWAWTLLWVVAAGGTAVLTTWAGLALPWAPEPAPPVGWLFVSGVVFAGGFALLLWRRLAAVGLVLLVVASIATWATVNPWYHGIGPLDSDPVVRAMGPLAKGAHPARVAVYGNEALAALVQASGVEMLSDVTLYPDRDVWDSLAPDQEKLWNNYAKYVWVGDRTVDPAKIEPLLGTFKTLRIDPCAPETLALDIDYTVSDEVQAFSCLQFDRVIRRSAQVFYVYRVVG
jgi:hypothetical protein